MRRRLLLFLAVALAAMVGGAAAAMVSRQLFAEYRPAIEIVSGQKLPDFSLTDQYGNRFSISSVRGKVVLLFFGYTHCPDVCPHVLSKYAKLYQALGSNADRVVAIFVSVDPERDTPEVLRKHLSYYSPKIVGLTGTPEEVKDVMTLYNIYAVKHPPDENGNYVIDHYALVLGADKNHVLRTAFTVDAPLEEYVKGVEWLLSKS
ncbi:MAG: SCO family protein [Candidatus Caldarchaeum sp.]